MKENNNKSQRNKVHFFSLLNIPNEKIDDLNIATKVGMKYFL